MATIGIPREVRDLEMRVGLSPAGVLSLTQAGHTVITETQAGRGAGFSDESYREVGAQVVYSAAEIYGRADIIAKIARLTEKEYPLLRPGQTIFSFLHLAVASPDLLQILEEKQITAVAYEMIAAADGHRPVLHPASEIAGRMAPLIAGHLLRSDIQLPGHEGLGILLGGIPGVPAAAVVILGGGTLGANAARSFLGLGTEVTLLDHNLRLLQQLDEKMDGRLNTMYANPHNIRRAALFADVLICAISASGSRTPILIGQDVVRQMRNGSVIIDYTIDDGGCVATSRPTSLRDPAYVAEGVVHYCVPNMTAGYARTTSYAITNAALPYLLKVADEGLGAACGHYSELGAGLNLLNGDLVHAGLAAALGRTSAKVDDAEAAA